MVFGFNSEIRAGNTLYHVQTEDRGPANPVIDTTIYTQGRVIHRRATSYKELLDSPGFDEAARHQRLEEQHRTVIEELRSGKLQLGAPGAAPPVTKGWPAGPSVILLNPGSWLSAGTASLRIEVKDQATGNPVVNAKVEVIVEGAQHPLSFQVPSDARGLAELTFPMPRPGPGGAELVIRASAPSGQDESRYTLKPKARSTAR